MSYSEQQFAAAKEAYSDGKLEEALELVNNCVTHLRKSVIIRKQREGEDFSSYIDAKMLQGRIYVKMNELSEVEGVLDLATLPVIQGVFERCLKRHLAIQLDLGGLIHITREGRNSLNEIKHNVNLIHLPEFMQLENRQRKG